MNSKSRQVQKTYLTITLLTTLATSFIWGINTLFLLDAGLNNTGAFAANAFFTLGQLVFEVPTGVIADTWGRRSSFLLGSSTLLLSTIFYLLMWNMQAAFWAWALASALLGLGFTFFSGAVEAWLVDSLKFTKYKGDLDPVFAKGQIVGGIAMLSGSVAGGIIAQFTNLGVPYILRAVILGLSFVVAYVLMKDLGFVPERGETTLKQIHKISRASIQHGWKNPPVRYLMMAAPFTAGIGFYAFYAMQPYLLELYGDPNAYSIAGLAAAIVASAQIAGGLSVSLVRKLFNKRTNILIIGIVVSSLSLLFIGLTNIFWLAVVLLAIWGLVFAATGPVRQAYINGEIPSKQRATVLSFDSLMGSSGGIFTQPALGKVADVYSYSASYILSSAVFILALPFVYRAKRLEVKSDQIKN